MATPPIAVYGANGHIGRFVVSELQRRGCSVLPVGRRLPHDDGQQDGAHGWRVASCDDPDALDQALHGTAAVINCAGPFLDTAPALIEAALRAGIHYLDVTAEQRSVRQSLATYDDEAREAVRSFCPRWRFRWSGRPSGRGHCATAGKH